MVCVTKIALFATAVLATPVRRDFAETLANLRAIDTAVNDLTTTVNGWGGDVLGALTIQSKETAIENAVDSANTGAQDETTSSSADSATAVNFLSSTGEPDIAKALNALVARKAAFTSAGLSSVVLTDLQNLKSKTDTYGATLLKITSTDQQAAATAVLNKVDADFATAVTAFSS